MTQSMPSGRDVCPKNPEGGNHKYQHLTTAQNPHYVCVRCGHVKETR